ncbi:hypothetical protein Krac_9718 [Ktedonobacter racemifer DSM 44963]|uniref:Uncharacterized protein n=1 Tax=Ktedonobacter racemifer DSM 44963 TaxID=485913 RepID=D6TDE6_KTERA|nr:hypothetical protein Krac_9718 [Ktedonobacter racemifer DSM 44963]
MKNGSRKVARPREMMTNLSVNDHVHRHLHIHVHYAHSLRLPKIRQTYHFHPK